MDGLPDGIDDLIDNPTCNACGMVRLWSAKHGLICGCNIVRPEASDVIVINMEMPMSEVLKAMDRWAGPDLMIGDLCLDLKTYPSGEKMNAAAFAREYLCNPVPADDAHRAGPYPTDPYAPGARKGRRQ